MFDTTKDMISYNDIVPIETYASIEDYIRQVNTFSPEIAGQMKYALNIAKTQEYSRGLVDGYKDSSEDHGDDDGIVPPGF